MLKRAYNFDILRPFSFLMVAERTRTKGTRKRTSSTTSARCRMPKNPKTIRTSDPNTRNARGPYDPQIKIP
eukprot:2152352-Amphidinium_carterae.2